MLCFEIDGFFVTLILIIFGFTVSLLTVLCSHFLLHARKQEEHVKILVYLGGAEEAWPITAQCSNIKEEEEWGFIF
jgi:hypothetical protein